MSKKKRPKRRRKAERLRIIAMLESRIWDLALERLVQMRAVLYPVVVWIIIEVTRR